MAIQNPWHIAAAAPRPVKPLQNPWNINIPGSGLASNNGSGGAIPLVNAPAPVVAAPAPVAPAPPPPPDFNALTLADPQYITAQQDRAANNQLAMASLLKNFRTTSQGYQDNANAHGALFSGAAVNAQRSAGQNYADQSAQQSAANLQGQHQDYNNVFQRLLNQLAGGS